MPLSKGRSKTTISRNIRELVSDWEQDRKIGNSRPKNREAAVKQAVAISLSKAGKSKP